MYIDFHLFSSIPEGLNSNVYKGVLNIESFLIIFVLVIVSLLVI